MIHAHAWGRAARYYPEQTAISSGGTRRTFRDLHDRVARTAAALAKHGFQSGDRLALLLPNEPVSLELVDACAWLGVIAVPVNTRLSVPEIDHLVIPRGLIRHWSLPVPGAEPSWELVLDQQLLNVQSESGPASIYDPEATLALVYTSGTTGHRKGVVVSHANILANVDHFNYWAPYQEGGVHLHAAPIFHILDFPFMFAAPAFGVCQVTIPKFDAQTFCETVERERVSQSVLVPTMINLLTQFDKFGKYDLTSLKTLAYGGSPMAPELIHRLQGYELSEAGFLTGLQDHEHTEDRLMSCGRTCPGIDLRVADESGKEVEPGAHGELVARGAKVMSGYWEKPEETKLAFRAGFFRTRDIGYRDAKGYFYILDRLKDMITGGENVYSGEVEAVIYQHPAVREAAVFGTPDSRWGELVAACVVRKPAMSLSENELIAHCRRSLANYKVPRRVELSGAELPKSGSGQDTKANTARAFLGRSETCRGLRNMCRPRLRKKMTKTFRIRQKSAVKWTNEAIEYQTGLVRARGRQLSGHCFSDMNLAVAVFARRFRHGLCPGDRQIVRRVRRQRSRSVHRGDPLGTYQGMTGQVVMGTPGSFRTVLLPRGLRKPEWHQVDRGLTGSLATLARG